LKGEQSGAFSGERRRIRSCLVGGEEQGEEKGEVERKKKRGVCLGERDLSNKGKDRDIKVEKGEALA